MEHNKTPAVRTKYWHTITLLDLAKTLPKHLAQEDTVRITLNSLNHRSRSPSPSSIHRDVCTRLRQVGPLGIKL